MLATILLGLLAQVQGMHDFSLISKPSLDLLTHVRFLSFSFLLFLTVVIKSCQGFTTACQNVYTAPSI